MIIDAMDLLYSEKIDAFALVSSDSDFTKLASRLRESEKFVFGVGEKKTPVSFRNACDDFVYTENLEVAETIERKNQEAEVARINNIEELIPLLNKAWEQFQDGDGWVNIAPVGSFLKRAQPDFDPRTYGATKITQLIQNLNKSFEMKKVKGKGTTQVINFKPKGHK